MKLSIIIPYHRTLDLVKVLLDKLIPQLNETVELAIIDDDVNTYDLDSYAKDNIKVIHHEVNSGCAGKPRNTGINNTTGRFITFIDADDLVADNYIERILDKIEKSQFDYCLFSWKYNGARHDEVIITDNPPGFNCSSWNCIYSREAIGNERFNETMRVAEDYDFNLRVRKGKKENILDILYFYKDDQEGSLTKEAQ